jgi:hypothetical protein
MVRMDRLNQTAISGVLAQQWPAGDIRVGPDSRKNGFAYAPTRGLSMIQ